MRIKVLQPHKRVNHHYMRVSAYVRVSSDSEEQEGSLENQTRYFEEYIQSHSDWMLGEVYADQGISGFSDSRSTFLRMLDDARRHKFEYVA